MYLKHGKKGYFLLPENQKKALFKAGKQCKNIIFPVFFVCRKESGKDDGRTGKADQRDADEGDGL